MSPDKAVGVIGCVAERLRQFFGPDTEFPPIGGAIHQVHVLAGDQVAPPPWVGTTEDCTDCTDCSAYLWVRLVSRWRTGQSQNMTASAAVIGKCNQARGITVEAGVARCHPLEGTRDELEQHALIQMDDSWRMDNALCAGMADAEAAGFASDTGLGTGEPYGPEGLLIIWTQRAYAQL